MSKVPKILEGTLGRKHWVPTFDICTIKQRVEGVLKKRTHKAEVKEGGKKQSKTGVNFIKVGCTVSSPTPNF